MDTKFVRMRVGCGTSPKQKKKIYKFAKYMIHKEKSNKMQQCI